MSKKKNKQELKERNHKYVRNYRENLKTDPKMATKYETMKEKEGKCQQKIREERKEQAQNDSKFRDFLRKKECERKRIQRKKKKESDGTLAKSAKQKPDKALSRTTQWRRKQSGQKKRRLREKDTMRKTVINKVEHTQKEVNRLRVALFRSNKFTKKNDSKETVKPSRSERAIRRCKRKLEDTLP